MNKNLTNRKTFIQAKLDQLESRLQLMVEGSTTHVLPLKIEHYNLPLRLVSIMKTGIHSDLFNNSYAPNLFTIVINPSDAAFFQENQTLLDELVEIIYQSATEAGLLFHTPPAIRVRTDTHINRSQLHILAERWSGKPNQTMTISVDIRGEATDLPKSAFLIVAGDRIYPLHEPVINIGRRIDNHLVIEDKRVSRLHAQLRVINGSFVIFDLDSTSGTFVNEKLIQQQILQAGDVISLGGVPLIYGQEVIQSSETITDPTRPLEIVIKDEKKS
jgi:hypothetical protein